MGAAAAASAGGEDPGGVCVPLCVKQDGSIKSKYKLLTGRWTRVEVLIFEKGKFTAPLLPPLFHHPALYCEVYRPTAAGHFTQG